MAGEKAGAVMRLYAKILVAVVVALAFQMLIDAAGGWREISFDARCIVEDWFPSAARHQYLLDEAERIRRAERDEAIARQEARERATIAAAAIRERPATRPAIAGPVIRGRVSTADRPD